MSRSPLTLPDPPVRIDRWQLRPWRTADAPELARAWAEPSVAETTAVPDDPSIDRARTWIAGEAERRRIGVALDLVIAGTTPVPSGDGPLGDEDPAAAGIAGEVGVVVADPRRGFGEIGWWLFPEARGRGLATRFVRAFGGHLLRNSGLRRLFARTPAGNTASERVATRVGMTEAGTAEDGAAVWILDP